MESQTHQPEGPDKPKPINRQIEGFPNVGRRQIPNFWKVIGPEGATRYRAALAATEQAEREAEARVIVDEAFTLRSD